MIRSRKYVRINCVLHGRYLSPSTARKLDRKLICDTRIVKTICTANVWREWMLLHRALHMSQYPFSLYINEEISDFWLVLPNLIANSINWPVKWFCQTHAVCVCVCVSITYFQSFDHYTANFSFEINETKKYGIETRTGKAERGKKMTTNTFTFLYFIIGKYQPSKSKNITFAVHPGHHSYGNRFIIHV